MSQSSLDAYAFAAGDGGPAGADGRDPPAESIRVARQVFLRMLDAMLITDPVSAVVVDANPSACELFDMTLADLLAVDCDALRDPADGARWAAALAERAAAGRFRGELNWRRGNGGVFPAEVTCSLFDVEGRTLSAIAVRDISEKVALSRQLTDALSEMERLATVDPLTGLLNRHGFMVAGAHLVEAASRAHQPVVVLIADVDALKAVNDTFGHVMGDKLLRDVATMLSATLHSADVIARVGGDEFAVILAGATARADAVQAGSRLNDQMEAYARRAERPYPLSVSVGIAVRTDDDSYSLDELLRRADDAMYEHKWRRITRIGAATKVDNRSTFSIHDTRTRVVSEAYALHERLLATARVLSRVAAAAAQLTASRHDVDDVDYRLEAHRWRQVAAAAHDLSTSGPTPLAAASPSSPLAVPTLSRREQQVIGLLPQALSFAQIAERVGGSPDSVRSEVIMIYRKLGATSRADAIDRAYLLGLLRRPQPVQPAD